MALATQKISGLLAGCGVFGRFLASQMRTFARVATIFKFKWLPWKKRAMLKLFRWQAAGSSNALVLQKDNGRPALLSFLDAYNNETLCAQILSRDNKSMGILHGQNDFTEWVNAKG